MSSGDFGSRRDRPFNADDIPWDEITKWTPRVLLGLVVVAVLFLGSSMFYRINASDAGVVLRFGEHIETVLPGLNTKLPWPIDKVYMVPVRSIQKLEFGFATAEAGRVTRYAQTSTEDLAVAEMLTGDLNLGRVEWIVEYRVEDPVQYLFNVGSTEAIDRRGLPSGANSEVNPAVPDTIRDVSESVMRKLVGDSSIDTVLILGREQIAEAAKEAIQEELNDFEAGVRIITVKLLSTSQPTAQVKDAFQAVNRAKQQKAKVVNEALGERNSILPEARGAKVEAILEAEGYANRVVLETTGKISAFRAQLDEYKKAPEVTRKRLYLEAMEEILAAVGSKTIIDESVRGVLPVLNLDQAAQRTAVEKGVQR
jgi:membrane protease subunit HflK